MSKRHEQLLFHYSSALERGDFEAVAEVLREAERDPALEQMILDLNAAYTAESPTHVQVKELPMTTILYPKRPSIALRWHNLPFAAALVVIALLVALLTVQIRGNNLPNTGQNGTNAPAIAQNQAICQATARAPINVTTLPGIAGVIIGTIPAGQVVTVLQRMDFSTIWYLVKTPTLQGWITIESLDTSNCNEPVSPASTPTPTPALNGVAQPTLHPTALARSDMAWSCSAVTNVAIDLLSVPSEQFGIVTGSLPEAAVVDVLDYNILIDSQQNKILWYYVKAGRVQGWMPTYLLNATSCPPIPDMQVANVATSTPTPAPNLQAGNLSPVTAICQGTLNAETEVRSRPQDNSVIFGSLPVDTTVTVLDQQLADNRTGDGWMLWFFIGAQVMQGWVHADVVSGACPQASVAEPTFESTSANPDIVITQPTYVPPTMTPTSAYLVYLVQQGDTLLYILQQPPFSYHTLTQATVNEILLLNPDMTSINNLPPVGSPILIPLPTPTAVADANQFLTATALAAPLHATALPADMVASAGHLYRVYTVQQSDTIVWIMAEFGIDASALPDVLRINHITENQVLQPGTLILLPADNLTPIATPSNLQAVVTVVATGEGNPAKAPICTVTTQTSIALLAAPDPNARVIEMVPAGMELQITTPGQSADGIWYFASANPPLDSSGGGFISARSITVPSDCTYATLANSADAVIATPVPLEAAAATVTPVVVVPPNTTLLPSDVQALPTLDPQNVQSPLLIMPITEEAIAVPATVPPPDLQAFVTVVATGAVPGGAGEIQRMPTCSVTPSYALDIFDAPSKDARVIEILDAGTQLQVTAAIARPEGIWYMVTFKEAASGYISPNSVIFSPDCAYATLEATTTPIPNVLAVVTVPPHIQPLPGYFVYPVQPGDTLASVIERSGLAGNALSDWLVLNHLTAVSVLSAGMNLLMPTGGEPARQPACYFHTTQPVDVHVSPDDLSTIITTLPAGVDLQLYEENAAADGLWLLVSAQVGDVTISRVWVRGDSSNDQLICPTATATASSTPTPTAAP